MTADAWGDEQTQFFYALTPDRILNAVEASTGLRCTGRALALNSMENRVYEIEIDLDEEPADKADNFIVAKFYRPGRWSAEQIREEHQFLADLHAEEIPVVPPIKLNDGDTLHQLDDGGLFYCIYPKRGGRSPDELNDADLEQVGRLLARLHNVGATRSAPHRIQLTPTTYGRQNLAYLLNQSLIPKPWDEAIASVTEQICSFTEPWFAEAESQRIHGDCHLGNLLWGRQGFCWVDFDDMVMGPPIQDLWLMIPSRDSYAERQWQTLVAAYDSMRPFDWRSRRLVEPLRALRFVHFAAWMGRRWQDPAFPRAFPQYGTDRYWQELSQDLREQLSLIQESSSSPY